jgi:hypothetical protein
MVRVEFRGRSRRRVKLGSDSSVVVVGDSPLALLRYGPPAR